MEQGGSDTVYMHSKKVARNRMLIALKGTVRQAGYGAVATTVAASAVGYALEDDMISEKPVWFQERNVRMSMTTETRIKKILLM